MREHTNVVNIGGVEIGGGNPVRIQSMCNTKTADVAATVGQIHALEEAGCELIRVTVPDHESALALSEINIRVGVNSGSLEKDLIEKYGGVTAEGLVESALDKAAIIEDMGYDNLVISIKSSDVLMSIKAHALISTKTHHPLHVGITEAGSLIRGNIKSAVGIGIILYEGIGDTIRVSLTADPVEEVRAAKLILSSLKLRTTEVELVSCPTCGRTEIDLIGLEKKVEEVVSKKKLKPLKISVMGCIVNGPGEAREADLGICGGKGQGLILRHGEIVRKVSEEELLPVFEEELKDWEITE